VSRGRDIVTLVAGVAITLLGALLLLDQTGAIDLKFDYAAPAVLGTAGVILLVSGLNR
jgi:uncharacterized membrane protein YidH (DUF202 family)